MPEAAGKLRTISYGDAVREGLTEAARRDPTVFMMAEGVDDPSSVFGTIAGIAKNVGEDRVVEMPVAENALTGIAIGAALSGRRPVISLHRVEFALLAVEQIFNNAAKSHYITNGRHKVPIVIRCIIGRGWGQGPEHSQSLETLFAYVPGLKVVMPAFPRDAKGLIAGAVEDDNPVIVIEHRWCHYATGDVPDGYYKEDLIGSRVHGDGKDITIVATSYMTLEAVRAAEALKQLGLSATVIDLRMLRPLNMAPIIESVRKTGRLLTVDTGWRILGPGAEIVAQVAQQCFTSLKDPPRRMGLPDHPAPSSRGLIEGFYPNAETILAEACAMIGVPPERVLGVRAELAEHRNKVPVDVPDPFFKGPF
jgi:acetoin:2,6-dichlorophenolindophenol oxidoreductase subunit beta